MKQEIIADLSRITEEEQAILDGKTEVEKERYSSGQKFVMDAGKLLKRGKLIDIRPHTRFIRFPAHSHNYVEMIYMCQGSTVHTINGDRIELKTGELLILNQNAVQEILPAGEYDIAVNFIVLPEFFNTAFSMIGAEENQLKDFLVGALCGRDEETSYLYFHVADILPVQNLIENMVWTIFYDISNKRSSNQITMGLLFLQLLNYMDKMEAGGRKFDTEIMANVYRYIEDHFNEGTLSELAVEMKVDVYWLSREIKKKSGKTYKELLQEKRMQQAVYLLINSRIAVSDIIEAVGYDNTSYFYRKFKERYGISPKEYRIENMN